MHGSSSWMPYEPQRVKGLGDDNDDIDDDDDDESGVTVCHTSKGRSSSQILVATAIVCVKDKHGQLMKCIALLDSGSQGLFVTERVVQLLHLREFEAHIPVQDINEFT
jgi:hypothetical protein